MMHEHVHEAVITFHGDLLAVSYYLPNSGFLFACCARSSVRIKYCFLFTFRAAAAAVCLALLFGTDGFGS